MRRAESADKVDEEAQKQVTRSISDLADASRGRIEVE